jgi:hypothetical protein
MFLAFMLQIMSTHTRATRSVLEKSLATPARSAPAPAPTGALPLEPQTAPSASTPKTTAPATAQTPPPTPAPKR